MRPQPLICVNDVEATSRWYQRLLGCRSGHGGAEYERIIDDDDGLILQLHRWEVEHDHRPIGDPTLQPYGNGVLLWFEVQDFDAAVARAEFMGVERVKPRHRNPEDGRGGPNHWECWIRDPNGYTVVFASPDGTAATGSRQNHEYRPSGRHHDFAKAGGITNATWAGRTIDADRSSLIKKSTHSPIGMRKPNEHGSEDHSTPLVRP